MKAKGLNLRVDCVVGHKNKTEIRFTNIRAVCGIQMIPGLSMFAPLKGDVKVKNVF